MNEFSIRRNTPGLNAQFVRRILPVYAVTGGCAAFVLRLIQNRTGFETETGLPIAGNAASLALPLLLAALAIGLIPLCAPLPDTHPHSPAFPFAVSTRDALPAMAGGILLVFAGLADLGQGLGWIPGLPDWTSTSGFSLWTKTESGMKLLMPLSGALTLLAGISVTIVAQICRSGNAPGQDSHSVRNTSGQNASDSNAPGQDSASVRTGAESLLLLPVALVVRLVAAYRLDSINPVLEDYAVELTTLTVLTLASYSFSAFAFECGNPRRFSFYASGAVILCLCALADGAVWLSSPPLYLGGGLVLLAFLRVLPSQSPGEPV